MQLELFARKGHLHFWFLCIRGHTEIMICSLNLAKAVVRGTTFVLEIRGLTDQVNIKQNKVSIYIYIYIYQDFNIVVVL